MKDTADWTGKSEQVDPDEPAIGRRRVASGGGQVIRTSALALWEALSGACQALSLVEGSFSGFYAAVACRRPFAAASLWTSRGGRYPIEECRREWLYHPTHLEVSAITSINPDQDFRSISSPL